ncbi:MAG: dehydrogenase, partial [Segetibacter sp.]|nr:dehydrogenase [Segetibacter sp.]
NHVYFGREKDGVLQSPFSGNLAEVCPTGVFTDKTLKEHYTRKWDLTMAPSVCHHCSVGCNTIAGERYGELRAVLNRYNGEVNGYFLCDRGRFGYEFVNSENRVKQPLVRHRTGEAVNEEELFDHLNTTLTNSKLIGIGSPRASMESNFALQQLVGAENFYQGISEDEAFLSRKVVQVLQSGEAHSVSLKEIEQADAILILGEDIWNTAPMVALAVRQSINKTAATNASQQLGLPVWQDAAIKEFAQEDKGLLVSITVSATPLDEIATDKLIAAPDNIARLGFAIAHELNTSSPNVPNADEKLLTRARIIATALRQAKRPVIISGISCYNEGIIKSALDIAAALNSSEKKAGVALVVPECNSMGMAIMNVPSFEHAVTRVQRESGMIAIIVENDLYRNISAHLVDSFFNKCTSTIVFDCIHNRTTEKADVLIPAATFAEGDGTLVNYEGRAQRYYQVFMPSNPFIKESWRWLGEMHLLKLQTRNGSNINPDKLLEKLESAYPQFEGITKVAPPHEFSIHGERIPREPHRYSGRTAMLANLNVSEPKPMQDNDSPLSYTMEGYKGLPPSSAIPFFWAPGWNSVQAVAKYQEEPGGALLGGDPGVKLFKDKAVPVPSFFKDMPEAFKARQLKWLLLPQYHVLGSGELSIYTKALKELSPEPFVSISVQDASQLKANNGDMLKLYVGDKEFLLPLKVQKELCNGIALVSAGLQGMQGMSWGAWARIEKSMINIAIGE